MSLLSSNHAISIVREARLRPDGYVALDLLVDGVPVTGLVHRSRSAGAPEAPSHDLEAVALHFTATYVEKHPLLFHQLFTASFSSPGNVSSVRIEPRGFENWLGFNVIVGDVPITMLVSKDLSFHPMPPPPTTDEESLLMLWASAYDICLAYVIENLEKVRSLGFDTAELVRQSAEIARTGSSV